MSVRVENPKKEIVMMARFKEFTAKMERSHDISFGMKGSGMAAYFDKELTKLFGKDMDMKAVPVRTRKEVELMVEMGFFDLDSSDNPILILKPLKEEADE